MLFLIRKRQYIFRNSENNADFGILSCFSELFFGIRRHQNAED
jgi:hypothetical protein